MVHFKVAIGISALHRCHAMIMTYKARVALSVATCKPYYSHTLIAFSGASFIVLLTWAGNYSHSCGFGFTGDL